MTQQEAPTLTLVNWTSAREGCEDCEYAVLEIDLKFTLYLLKLIGVAEVFKGISEGFHRVSYFVSGPDYYKSWDDPFLGNDDISDEAYNELEEAIEQGEWVIMPASYKRENPTRVETETLGVDEHSVIFKAYQKHCDAQFETYPLLKPRLAEIAGLLMTADAKAKACASQGRESRVVTLDKPGDTQGS